jgi:hypothetical protein
MQDSRQDPPSRLPAALAGALERAAGMIARLDSALAAHPLAPAWAWRARLDAVRRQAMVDGQAIDPWHLAALIEGVRFRLGQSPALIDRGALFAAAHHAFDLYRWFSAPDEAQRAAIRRASDHLAAVGDGHSPLVGAAFGVHAWLDQDGERPPIRAEARPREFLSAADGGQQQFGSRFMILARASRRTSCKAYSSRFSESILRVPRASGLGCSLSGRRPTASDIGLKFGPR